MVTREWEKRARARRLKKTSGAKGAKNCEKKLVWRRERKFFQRSRPLTEHFFPFSLSPLPTGTHCQLLLSPSLPPPALRFLCRGGSALLPSLPARDDASKEGARSGAEDKDEEDEFNGNFGKDGDDDDDGCSSSGFFFQGRRRCPEAGQARSSHDSCGAYVPRISCNNN